MDAGPAGSGDTRSNFAVLENVSPVDAPSAWMTFSVVSFVFGMVVVTTVPLVIELPWE
jgi:hypothetical protein